MVTRRVVAVVGVAVLCLVGLHPNLDRDCVSDTADRHSGRPLDAHRDADSHARLVG